MYNKKYILGIAVLFLMISFVNSAVPVQLNVNQDRGINIFYPKFSYVPQNTAFTLQLHLSNISDGKQLYNNVTDCFLYLYDIDGTHTFENGVMGKDSNGFDHIINITANNFSNFGIHSYYIFCNTTDIGGSAHGTFTVTEGGVEITEARSILVIGLMGILIIFMFASLFVLFNVENYMAKFISYWISHILMIIISFIGWQIGVEGLLVGMALTGIFRILFWIFIVAMLPMIYVSISWIVYIHAYNEHFQKLIDKGEDPETAFAIANKKKGWIFGN